MPEAKPWYKVCNVWRLFFHWRPRLILDFLSISTVARILPWR